MAITIIIKEKRPIGVISLALTASEENKKNSMVAGGKIIFQQNITIETTATHVTDLKIRVFKDQAALDEWNIPLDLTARQTYNTANNIVQEYATLIL